MQVCPIGIVHSAFSKPEGTPIQATASVGSKAIIEVYNQYIDGLKDIDGFSHLILRFNFAISFSSNKRSKITSKTVFR